VFGILRPCWPLKSSEFSAAKVLFSAWVALKFVFGHDPQPEGKDPEGKETMGANTASPVTELLLRWNGGERSCLDELIPLLEQELRRIAHCHMRNERPGHTLQTTALINEAYLKLVDQSRANWANRAHFLAAASGIMRHLLVDHARGLCRERRGGAKLHLPLKEDLVFSPAKSKALVALNDALDELEELNPRKAQVVEMRYFGGLSVEEAAEALGVHPNTIVNDWRLARAWLKRELARGAPDEG